LRLSPPLHPRIRETFLFLSFLFFFYKTFLGRQFSFFMLWVVSETNKQKTYKGPPDCRNCQIFVSILLFLFSYPEFYVWSNMPSRQVRGLEVARHFSSLHFRNQIVFFLFC
jgi:hypothetical protein